MTATRERQTQAERRALTIRKLTRATIDSLFEVGYARTTVKEICGRAGLSDGALFRFFPTLLDLILATGGEIARRQIAEFEARFNASSGARPPLVAALTVLRAICRSKTNTVFHELVVAARTDAALRKKLAPGIRAYNAAIRDAARKVPSLSGLPDEVRDAIVFGAAHLFDGEAMVRRVCPQPAAEEARLALLTQFAATLGG